MRRVRRSVLAAAMLALTLTGATAPGWAQIADKPGETAAPAAGPATAPAAATPSTAAPASGSPAAPPAADTPAASPPGGVPPAAAAPVPAPAVAPSAASPTTPATTPAAAPASPSGGEKVVRIGTNAVAGLYYPAGGAICRMMSRLRDAGWRCLVDSTSGSTANVRALRGGDLEFGIVQSDWQYYALQGNGAFKAGGPVKELRSVFSLYPESLTVIVRKDAAIGNIEQIKGKRIAAGPSGSGQRILFDALVAALGWRQQEAGTISDAADSAAVAAFCGGTVDVVVMLTHHPSPLAQEMVVRCNATFLPVAGIAAAKLLKDRPYYAPATIAADSYGGMTPAVETLGVRATVVTVERVPDDMVYALVKAVFDNLDAFIAQHPGLAGLKREEMVKAALSAPLHEGARRYFREKGLLP